MLHDMSPFATAIRHTVPPECRFQWQSGPFGWAIIKDTNVPYIAEQVKKIHENEKRLEAGDHTMELLAHDFEKNYNMYIFPVHWQFGQLDQHPVDG